VNSAPASCCKLKNFSLPLFILLKDASQAIKMHAKKDSWNGSERKSVFQGGTSMAKKKTAKKKTTKKKAKKKK
jgi:hypothetical protein